MSWVLLFAAAAFEAVWALALKASAGLTRPAAALAFLIALVASVALLALAMRDLPVGTAYAVWTGTGAVGAALLGILVLGEHAAPGRLLAIGLIAGGVAWLALAG